MKKIIIKLECAGDVINISKGTSLRYISFAGIEAVNYQNEIAENNNNIGGTLLLSKITPRNFELTFGVKNDINIEKNRIKVMSFFKPFRDITVYVTREDRTRKIICRVNGAIHIEQQNIVYDDIKVNVPLIAAMPYFEDVNPVVVPFGISTPLTNAPFTISKTAGFTPSIFAPNQFKVENTGDVSIGFYMRLLLSSTAQIDILSEFGNISFPVDKTKGLFEINTEPGNVYINKNGQSFYNFKLNSVFFLLPPGTHSIKVGDAHFVQMHEGYIQYTPKYIGA